MKIMRFILLIFEALLFICPNLYYQAAFNTGNSAVILAFFLINYAFIKSLEYMVKLLKESTKPTR